jgi:hypothetical protein
MSGHVVAYKISVEAKQSQNKEKKLYNFYNATVN